MPDFSSYPFEKHGLEVSFEAREKFARYAALLTKWQKAINLVGADTMENMLERHFLDSAQIFPFLPDKNIRLADMGSGAGFPGMVLAILDIFDVHLIESDLRKATFLREVSRETNTPVTIHDDRVEDVSIENLNVVTARALAPLKDLLRMAHYLKSPRCIFLKGEKTEEEIEKAKKEWNFDLSMHTSITDFRSKVLIINNLIKK